MANIYLQNNVFEEALERIRFVYDNHDDVIVSMSGGKDSAVLFELTSIVAHEKNRLPIKVFWLDQECEWQATVDYMKSVCERSYVEPYIFCVPMNYSVAMSNNDCFIIWDETKKDLWTHQPFDFAITKNPLDEKVDFKSMEAYKKFINDLPKTVASSQNTAVLIGMRISENLNRRMLLAHGKARFKGVTWAKIKNGNIQDFYPIYDFNDDDIWTALGKNHWDYNKIYDKMYQYGVPKREMRISALIHETSIHAIELLQEFEPDTYNKFLKRLSGVNAMVHTYESEGSVTKIKLPFMFKNWKEYRDYLLEKIVIPSSRPIYEHGWKGQDTDEWYMIHVKQMILNDLNFTTNNNAKSRMRKDEKIGDGDNANNKYYQAQKKQFDEFMKKGNE